MILWLFYPLDLNLWDYFLFKKKKSVWLFENMQQVILKFFRILNCSQYHLSSDDLSMTFSHFNKFTVIWKLKQKNCWSHYIIAAKTAFKWVWITLNKDRSLAALICNWLWQTNFQSCFQTWTGFSFYSTSTL